MDLFEAISKRRSVRKFSGEKVPNRILEKTPSSKGEWIIKLKPLPKITENVKTITPDIYLVGFKAEYNIRDEELIERAYKRMRQSEMDLIRANDVAREGSGFGTDTNEVFIIDSNYNKEHLISSKLEIAEKILDHIKNTLDRKPQN